jgi:hypothetical protein
MIFNRLLRYRSGRKPSLIGTMTTQRMSIARLVPKNEGTQDYPQKRGN